MDRRPAWRRARHSPVCCHTLIAREIILALGLAQLGAATGDAVTLWRTRDLIGLALVRDHGSRLGCVVLAEPGTPCQVIHRQKRSLTVTCPAS